MTVTARPMDRRSFSEVSALVRREPGSFEAVLDPEWTIGGKPNGGYLLAMLGGAAASVSAHDHVIAASAHYLHAPEPGPVLIGTEVLRAGRSTSQVRARLEQGGNACVEALITVSHLNKGTQPYWDRGLPGMSNPRFEECVRLVPILPNGKRVAIMEQVDLRLEPQTQGFTTGQPAGRGELRGWLALPGGEAFDPSSLLYALDSFPPATFDIEFSGWVPTLELTAYVRAIPVPGPVRVLQRARLIDAGRVDEACFIWDSAGRLVAQGTQLAGIRLE
jgi:acyl-coenzyme A thioesterase PaaI-like protein